MTVAIPRMTSAKLARRSRLTGGSPARVSPKIEYSPVFARPSPGDALPDMLMGGALERPSRPLRIRLLAAPVVNIELLHENRDVIRAIGESVTWYYCDGASQVSQVCNRIAPRRHYFDKRNIGNVA